MDKLITIDKLDALAKTEITKDLVETSDFGHQYALLKEAIDYLTGLKKEIDSHVGEVIAPLYMEDGTTTISNDKYSFTYCAPTTSLTVDTAKLKKEFPDVYKQCVKTTSRNASLRVTEKKIGGNDNA